MYWPSFLSLDLESMLAASALSDHLLSTRAGILGLIALIFVAVRFFWSRPLHHVPGPWLNRYSDVLLTFHELRSNRNQKVAEWHRKYGPIVCISPNEVSVASLEGAREIYGASGRYDKSSFFNNFVAYGARSVFTTLPFEDHKRKRPLVSSFFQASNIFAKPAIEALIRDRVFSVLGLIEKENPGEEFSSVEFFSIANWYAFDNITALIFGPVHASTATKGPCEERGIMRDTKRAQAWSPIRRHFSWLMPMVKTILSRVYKEDIRYFSAQKRLEEWSYKRTMETLQDPNLTGFDCLVAHLVGKLPFQPQKVVSETSEVDDKARYIAAESVDNINAAEASVAATITNAIWLLTIYPDWQRAVRKELQALSMQPDGLPSFSDIDRAPLLDACIKETHRLKPATGARAERVVPEGGRVVSNVYLPAKTVVSSSVIAFHSDPTLFIDEAKFCPSRWLEEGGEGKMSGLNASLMPFGYGTRICLGKAVANIEMKLLLAGLLLRYETMPAGTHTAEGMKQSSRFDGVKRGLTCDLEFRPLPGLN